MFFVVQVLQNNNNVYRIMTIFPLLQTCTLILRTQLVGEIMIEPYRVMIEP